MRRNPSASSQYGCLFRRCPRIDPVRSRAKVALACPPSIEIRDRVVELLRLSSVILKSPPEQRPTWIHQRLALIPTEAMKWIAVMDKPDCPPDEQPSSRIHPNPATRGGTSPDIQRPASSVFRNSNPRRGAKHCMPSRSDGFRTLLANRSLGCVKLQFPPERT